MQPEEVDLTRDSEEEDDDFDDNASVLSDPPTVSFRRLSSLPQSQSKKSSYGARAPERRPKLATVLEQAGEHSLETHRVQLSSITEPSELVIVVSVDELCVPIKDLPEQGGLLFVQTEVCLTTHMKYATDPDAASSMEVCEQESDSELTIMAFVRRGQTYDPPTPYNHPQLVPNERWPFRLQLYEPQPGESRGQIVEVDLKIKLTLQSSFGVNDPTKTSTIFNRTIVFDGALAEGTSICQSIQQERWISSTIKLEGVAKATRKPRNGPERTVPCQKELEQSLTSTLMDCEAQSARETAARLADAQARHSVNLRPSNTNAVDPRSTFVPLPPIAKPSFVAHNVSASGSSSSKSSFRPAPRHNFLDPQEFATLATGPPTHAIPLANDDDPFDQALLKTENKKHSDLENQQRKRDFTSACIALDVFEAEDPRVRTRNKTGLSSLLQSLDLAEEVSQQPGSVGLGWQEKSRLAAEDDEEIGPSVRLATQVFESRTGVSVHETAHSLHGSGEAIITKPSSVRFCQSCLSLECRVHGYQASPNVPTATSFKADKEAEGQGIPIKGKRQTVKGLGNALASRGYKPCSHGGTCSTRTCSCLASGIFCDRFCGCDGSCPRRFRGCNCHDGCRVDKCQCSKKWRECDPLLCLCGSTRGCSNASIRRGERKLTIVAESLKPSAGLGLFLLESVSEGDFIDLYAGEKFTGDKHPLKKRHPGEVLKERLSIPSIYAFTADKSHVLDAENMSNHTRYINAIEPYNCVPRLMYISGSCQMAFYALRDIEAGEELSFDYGEDYPMDGFNKTTHNKGV